MINNITTEITLIYTNITLINTNISQKAGTADHRTLTAGFNKSRAQTTSNSREHEGRQTLAHITRNITMKKIKQKRQGARGTADPRTYNNELDLLFSLWTF